MKRNTFYIILGLVILAEVLVFWLAVDLKIPLLMQIAFILGVAIIYFARRRIEDIIEDERTGLITQKAALRTLEVFWIAFFAISLGQAVLGLGAPGFPRMPPPGPGMNEMPTWAFLGRVGVFQMVLLGLIIILYVGFRMYYARKYGEWEKDEE